MTKIEWTDTVWNPTVGCSRVSPGCERCYAERLAHRGLSPSHRGLTIAGANGPRWNGTVRLLPERLEDPLRWRKPRRVFVNSMSDLFHEAVPDEFIDQVFAAMQATLHHTYQVLTKRPNRMRAYFKALGEDAERICEAGEALTDEYGWCHANQSTEWPLRNVHLGVSAENQETFNKRVPLLLETPAAVRFVSCEPLLGPIDLRLESSWCDHHGINSCRACCDGECPLESQDEWCECACHQQLAGGLDWIIVGGESGPGARPCHVDWIRSIVQQCKAAGVACFVKQLGARPRGWCSTLLIPGALGHDQPGFCDIAESCEGGHCGDRCWHLKSRKGADPAEWPEDLRVREVPDGE